MLRTIVKNSYHIIRIAEIGKVGYLLAISIFLLSVITGCEDYSQNDYQEHVVLEAYATANRPLPEVRLSTTLPTGQQYSFEEAGLAGADVQVTLLDEDGGDEIVFDYQSSSETRGLYLAEDQSHKILPRRTYRIDVRFDDRADSLSAETTIPDDVEVISEVPDTLVYQSSQQLEFVLSPIERIEKQNIFVFNNIALQTEVENLTPFYRELVVDEEEDIEDFYNNDSGPLNEENFDINSDGTITIQYPWLSVAFFGDNQVVTNAIDKNLSDLIISQDVQLGGGSLSPGEIPNLRYHVEGGIGIFGSLASDTVQTFFKRPEEI